MIQVVDRIAECDDGKHRELDLDDMRRLAWHRISFAEDDGAGYWKGITPIPDDELTGPSMARRFIDKRRVHKDQHHYADRPGSYSGGQTPYVFLLKTDGGIDQCLKVSDYAPHAMRWSHRAVSIVAAGNFNKHPPTREQWQTAIEFGALWSAWGTKSVGHTELPGSSLDPEKECPGKLWPMTVFRIEIEAHPYSKLSAWAAEKMIIEALGVVL